MQLRKRFREILSLESPLDRRNFPEVVYITHNKMKKFPTRSDLHILVPSVIPFRIDIRGIRCSLCCFASITRQRCKSLKSSFSFLFEFSVPISSQRDLNRYLSNPVPLICSISAGTIPNNPCTLSERGTPSNAF